MDRKGAILGDATEIRYAELTNCKLQQVGTEFSRKPYAIAVQTGSALKDQISSAILKLLNQRELETLKENWWHKNPKKKNCPDPEDESDGISIQVLTSARSSNSSAPPHYLRLFSFNR